MKAWQELDKLGNRVECDEQGKVTLKLKAERRVRDIGYISTDGSYVKVGLKETKHKFRTFNGWGLNWCVLNRMKEDALVILNIERADGRQVGLKALRKDIMGDTIKMFSKVGYECQFIVPETCFEEYAL